MSKKRKFNLAHLKTWLTRQLNPSWGPDYQASIRATKEEAPAFSNVHIVNSAKFCREIHLLSNPELDAYLLGCYNQAVIGLQEQRMISPLESAHPLSNFPDRNPAWRYPPLPSLIDVANELGYSSYLYKLKDTNTRSKTYGKRFVSPHFSDLLWAIRDQNDRIYCVNWTIKKDLAGFKEPFSETKGTASQQKISRHLAKIEIEKAYYEKGGIKTHQVASADLNRTVINNLRRLHNYQIRKLCITRTAKAALEGRFQTCLEARRPLTDLIPRLLETYCVADIMTCFYQAIWDRRLKVDLFKPILPDRCLTPEVRNPLELYSHLFSEK